MQSKTHPGFEEHAPAAPGIAEDVPGAHGRHLAVGMSKNVPAWHSAHVNGALGDAEGSGTKGVAQAHDVSELDPGDASALTGQEMHRIASADE